MPKTKVLPLLPLRGIVVFPYMMMHLDATRPKSVAAVEEAMVGDRKIFILAQKNENEEPTLEDLFDVGTIAEVRQVLKMPGGGLRVLIEGLCRGIVKEITDKETYTQAEVEEHRDQVDKSLQTEALSRAVAHQFEDWVRITRRVPADALVSVAIIEDAGRLSDLIASHLNIELSVRQDLLSRIDLKDRMEKLFAVLARELDVLELERKIGGKVREKMEKLQRDVYLREQLKAIHEELGEGEDRLDEANTYKEKLQKGKYPEEVKKVIEKEINRMSTMAGMSPELTIVRNYLDWLVELPWEKESTKVVPLPEAEKILEKDHYGLEKVKDRILDFLAVHQLTKDRNAPILCFVGPPGVGKTSLAASIARATGRKFIRASLGGVRDEAEIRGHRRTYVGALPGRIIDGIRKAGVKNPVFLLDEIDKVDASYHGDPSAALLEVLDPAQNNSFTDHYLDLPFDLSKVFWILTANNLQNVPRPLRDRMEIIPLSSYTSLEKYEIAKRYLLPRQREKNGLKARNLNIGAGVIDKIITDYTREAGVRELERVMDRLCRKAARHIVEGKGEVIRVNTKNLSEFLDKPKFTTSKAQKKPQVGVVTGMAWTETGGDILPTEASVLRGKGELILTGQLGDVMQESAKAGMSYVRSRADVLKLKRDFYEKNDIHIHLPEGAIPKDGPSAGITMATAMISALTGRKVRSDVAMTGEITLRGNVLPIGGLKEKVLAAYREGMQVIILPKENEKDIEEIPEVVREKLTFVPVENMDEVLETAML